MVHNAACENTELKNNIFANGKPILFIEAGSHRSLSAFYGSNVALIDIARFGISGAYEKLYEEFELTDEAVYAHTKEIL